MDFAQLQERLRLELIHRIERGVLTGSLLARQTGLRPSHISNFLQQKRRLSLDAMDRVLRAQHLELEHLYPRPANPEPSDPASARYLRIPLVSAQAASAAPRISEAAALDYMQVLANALENLPQRRPLGRKDWQRFVAIHTTEQQAAPMRPLFDAGAALVIDRLYNSLQDVSPPRQNLYAIRHAGLMRICYAALLAERIVLRPHRVDFPLEVIQPEPGQPPLECIVGRVCYILTPA